jgi:hypothetical protein
MGFLGSSGATLIVALGHAPNRRRIDLSKPTTPSVNQYCKNGGDHRFFPPEPIRYLGSLMVRNAIRRKERAEDHGRRPRHLDVRLAKFAAAAGKADKG